MSNKLQELKKKLAEIFQLDQTDLDFGIYRIMNQKSKEISDFLEGKLLNQVKKSFAAFEKEGQAKVKSELDKLTETLKQAGMNPDDSPKIQERKKQFANVVDVTSLENEVFSHLTNFFSRYYEDGDFLSLRRYKKDVYALPYEGEEVKLYWANSDQYYIKSSENFRDYSFKLSDNKTVHFKLVEAETEKDNNKTQNGKERFFMLCKEKALFVENGELFIRFNYIADQSNTKQAKHNEQAINSIKTEIAKSEYIEFVKLLDSNPTEKNKLRTVLEKHLTDYTAKNTFDYFIHKDLGGFLRRELDFYIKNEVLFIDDLDENNIKYSFNKAKAIKKIAHKIIELLEQLENFQKKLWLKKKFVIQSEYCITLDKVPAELHPEIVKNKAQIEEWKRLFAIEDIQGDLITISGSDFIYHCDNEEISKATEFLKQNPYLVLDTKFFSQEFKERLLESIHALDEQTDGVLINSDNFYALSLLQEKYQKKIQYIYIDPPYNTDSTPILYKNSYRHSSWASLLQDRLTLSMNLLKYEGVKTVAIDDTEMTYLSMIMEKVAIEHKLTKVTVVHNPKGSITKDFNRVHEYALFLTHKDVKDCIARTLEKNETPRKMRRWGENSLRTERRLSFYPIYIKNGKITRIGEVPDNDFHPNAKNIQLVTGETEIWPIDQDGIERRWNFGLESINENIERIIILEVDGQQDLFLTHELTVPKTVWVGGEYDAGNYGNTLLINILGKKYFDFPKSIKLVERCVYISTQNANNSIILDYFAGSGTTGHAVINLNRENEGRRKYILVEMGEYFDSVTKPRIQKVIYSKDWKDGKPISREGSSQIFKYMKLESYEDALNNLKQKDTGQISIALANADDNVKEKYMLSYMMDFEYSNSILNIEMFNNPFDYKMNISNGTETKTVNVDLVETFNYLIGLNVRTIYNSNGFKIIEGYDRKEENILVIWRNLEEKSSNNLDELFKKLRVNSRDYAFDKIFVNGDNNLENLKLDTDIWKVNLIEKEFKKRMFDVQDI